MQICLSSHLFFIYLFIFLSFAHGQLEGPCVLQVQKVRNISAPKDHEESQGAPRMLRLQMTDGHTTCVGLEFKHLSKIRYYSFVAFKNNRLWCNVNICERGINGEKKSYIFFICLIFKNG